MTSQEIELELERLRIEYRDHPDKREVIEKQAKALQIIKEIREGKRRAFK